jgi:capping protein alpha
MDGDERIQTAAQFLLQAPPGEINDVLNGARLLRPRPRPRWPRSHISVCVDVRNIIADDEALQVGLLPALREYNLAQFIVADVPGASHQVRACAAR